MPSLCFSAATVISNFLQRTAGISGLENIPPSHMLMKTEGGYFEGEFPCLKNARKAKKKKNICWFKLSGVTQKVGTQLLVLFVRSVPAEESKQQVTVEHTCLRAAV